MFCLQECKKLDRNINDLENNKMEFQKKIVVLNNRLIKVQKNIDDSIKNIEDISAAKIKVCIFTLNLTYIVYKLRISIMLPILKTILKLGFLKIILLETNLKLIKLVLEIIL